MKDSEFIELLNLYLDHEISAQDAARLEAEVQGNPARRRVYEDYCRMQKACRMLAQDFVVEPAANPASKVIDFSSARPRRASVGRIATMSGSLVAAAACLAFLFVGTRDRSTSTSGTEVAVQSPPAATASVQIAAAPAPATSPRGGIERRSAADALLLRGQSGDGSLVLMAGQQQIDPHFAWLNDVRLAPIQVPAPTDQLRFDVRSSLQSESRTFTSGNQPAPEVPIAIRFQK